MTRRDWIQSIALLSAGICTCHGKPPPAGTSAPSCCSTPDLEPQCIAVRDRAVEVDLSRTALLRDAPSAANLIVPERNLQLIVVRRRKREFVVLSRLCTHASQALSFVEGRGLLQCNGFNHSTFALDGRVVKGPAEKPLRCYTVRLEKQVLVIDLATEDAA